MRSQTPFLSLCAFVVCALAAPSALAQYTETVTFSFRSDSVTYQGPLDSAYLMLDVEGGRNRVNGATRMTCTGNNPKDCSVTLELEEGNYIYVYVANPDAFVNLNDPALNPDDIPDSNFFRDPTPRDSGFCGQFSTDNCLYVRNPARPTMTAESFSPGHGALVEESPLVMSVAVVRGSDDRPIDATSAEAFYEDTEPARTRFADQAAPQWVSIPDVSFNANGSGGTLSATLPNPPEGFHRVRLRIANSDGLAADDFITGVMINRDNQAPIAHAGPTLFASPGQEVILTSTLSDDPDRIGFLEYQWRVVDGPGGGNFRCVDAELIPRDGFGKPLLDESGNPRGDDCGRSDFGAYPRFSAQTPGTYTIGLRVRDVGGALSEEATTNVIVVPGWNLNVKPRVEVAIDDAASSSASISVDASLTVGGGANATFVEDAENPAPLNLNVSGRVATFTRPSVAGAYFVHVLIDNSYPATAIIRVPEAGPVTGADLARPPKAWATEKVLYLGYVREFVDSDDDGEGDIIGMIDRIEYLADLGINAMWLMPLSEGPTTHGYATTGYFGVEEDYGTPEQMEDLALVCDAFGIELLMDYVANHTSDQHPFFKAANQNLDSPLRDYYAFDADGSYRYAFTFFALPDQNQNSAEVRRTLLEVVDWHFDRGIKGIRADIASFSPPSFWRTLRRRVKARAPDAVMLAELLPPMAEYFDDAFDLAYDASSFWSLRDSFASGGSFDGLDGALEGATRFVESAYSERVRQSVRQEDVYFMRYIDNQDEDRFLLRAAGDVRKAKSVAAVLMTLPGTPLITYGNEVGISELRGRMPFHLLNANNDTFPAREEGLRSHYRKLIRVRRGNRALRLPDNAGELQNGNTYLRVSSNFDEGGGNVYSYLRYGDGQRFLVMANRADSTAIGTQTRVFPPASLFENFPEGQLTLVDHLNPSVRLNVAKSTLTAASGFTTNVPAFGARVFQVTRYGIPDADDDGILDSYDNCVGVENARQVDSDDDGVGDRCDACSSTPSQVRVGRDGCERDSSAQTTIRYALDGDAEEDGDWVVSESGDMSLSIRFNGQKLYVSTEAAARGEDVFILVTDQTGRTAAAPFAKAGTVPTDGIFLADEGENDFTNWFATTGESVAATKALPGRGVLEGTLNLYEEFGEIPDIIYVAAVRYGADDGASLVAQVPAGNGDDTVDPDEMFPFDTSVEVVVGVDAGPQPEPEPGPGEPEPEANEPEGDAGVSNEPDVVVTEGDADGDGVEDLIDNCVGTFNPSQADFDQDGFGDGCDACPLTAPGVTVDETGCGERPGGDNSLPDDRANPQIGEGEPEPFSQTECGCDATGDGTSGVAGLLALVALLGMLRVRRRV